MATFVLFFTLVACFLCGGLAANIVLAARERGWEWREAWRCYWRRSDTETASVALLAALWLIARVFS